MLGRQAPRNNRLVDPRPDGRERRREFGAPLSTVVVFVWFFVAMCDGSVLLALGRLWSLARERRYADQTVL